MEDIADLRQPIAWLVQVDELCNSLRLACLFDQHRAQAIVRADKKLLPQAGCDRAASRAYPRIDYRQVDRTGRKIRRHPSQRQRAFRHVLGLDLVCNVCQLGPGRDAPDNAFHHTHIAIFKTKIC